MLGKFNGGIFATLVKNIKWRRCLYRCLVRCIPGKGCLSKGPQTDGWGSVAGAGGPLDYLRTVEPFQGQEVCFTASSPMLGLT